MARLLSKTSGPSTGCEYVTPLSRFHTPEFLFGLNPFVDLLCNQLLPKLVTYCGSSFCSHYFCGSGIWESRGRAVLAQHLLGVASSEGSPGAGGPASQLAAGGRPQFLPLGLLPRAASVPHTWAGLLSEWWSRSPEQRPLTTPSTFFATRPALSLCEGTARGHGLQEEP